VGFAVLWDRLFQQPNYRQLRTVGDPPRGVLAMSPRRSPNGLTGFVLHADDEPDARELLASVPAGLTFLHLTNETPHGLVRARAARDGTKTAWLYALGPDDFQDLEAHETLPVPAEAAREIAETWSPDWSGAEAYVRGRIQGGPSRAVFADGRPAAWALTHFVTDRVAMLGFFHVRDAFRRKGYAKSAASALVKDVLGLGKIPALHVFTDNEASLRLVERIGFRRVRLQVWGDALLR